MEEMIKWSLSAEILAFMLVIVTVLLSYDKKRVASRSEKYFDLAIMMAGFSIILNVICVITIQNYDKVPYAVNMILNSFYFLISVYMSAVMAAYFFELILEHVYRKDCRTRATVGVTILLVGYTLLVISNIWNRCLFWFDETGTYRRGILNKSGYFVMLIELVMVGMCYRKNKKSVAKRARKILHMLPFIAILLTIFQLIFPELLLNGTMIVFVLIASLVDFRNLKLEAEGLSGIGNRNSFYEEISLRLKGNQPFQIVVVSLKEFTLVNQQFGYHNGNEFLYLISHWLKDQRKDAQVFRFGNMTFLLLCSYTNEEESAKLLGEITERFNHSWKLGEMENIIPATFSHMKCKDARFSATQTIEMLSFLIETAKKREAEVLEFDENMEKLFQERKTMRVLLKDAVKKKMFEVWYQPVYDCQKQTIISAEALVRLRGDDNKLISPAIFIPLAEESGIIEDIGNFVWEEVCRFLGEQKILAPKHISVNFSMQQFRNPKLLETLEKSLKKYEVPCNKIKLEITERVILQDTKHMEQQMKAFSKKGLSFCMDDFGTGYSNFYSLMHLPFDVIKLDKSLLDRLAINARDRMIIQSMINLFHDMGMEVVSEGIETEKQKKMIQEMGTDYIQGFYYAKPMPENEFIEFLSREALQ